MAAISIGPRIRKRQPALNTPDPSYHGAVWTEAVKPLGPIAYIIKARVTLLRDIGSAMSPFNAFLTLQGVETLTLRIAKHCENTQAVTDFLRKRPEVTRVIHPSVQTGVHRERAQRYLKGGLGGLVGFELAGGKDAGRRFIDALEMFYHVANIGDTRSLAIHPATTTHSQLYPQELDATGVTDGYVRLSVGIEHIDDIIADIERGLSAAGKLAKAAWSAGAAKAGPLDAARQCRALAADFGDRSDLPKRGAGNWADGEQPLGRRAGACDDGPIRRHIQSDAQRIDACAPGRGGCV